MERALRRPAGAWHDWRKLLQPRELPLLLFLRASSKKATTPPKAHHNEQAHSSKEKDHSIEGEAVRDAVSGVYAAIRARHGGQTASSSRDWNIRGEGRIGGSVYRGWQLGSKTRAATGFRSCASKSSAALLAHATRAPA